MELSNFYFKALRWGIFISLFVPLIIFSQYLSPFHFGKMIVFRILIEIMVVLYIPLMIADKRYRPKRNIVFISFSIFAGLYLLTGLTGVNFYNSFWGSLERMGGIFSFLHLWVYFLIFTSVIKTELDWNKVFKVSTGVGFLSILFAYGQMLVEKSAALEKSGLSKFFVGWQHGERVIGTIGNPALFAGYLLFVLYLAIFLLLKNKLPAWQKWFFGAVIALGTPILMVTAVRGAIIAFWGSLFLLGLFLLFKSQNSKIKKYLSVGIVVFVLLVVIMFIGKGQGWFKNNSWLGRVTDISTKTDTIQTRLWAWSSAIKGWEERPILGWGPENFMFLHMKYFNSKHFTGLGSETIWDRAHNMVLESLSTMGILGLISYLSIFFLIFYVLIKKFKEGKISKNIFGVLCAMIIAYFVQDLFIFDTTANYLMFLMVLGYVNFLNSREEDTDSSPAKDPSLVLTVILLIFSLILIFSVNIKSARANFTSTRAIIATNTNIQKAFNYYQQAMNINAPQGKYEIINKFAIFAMQVVDIEHQKNQDIDVNLLHYAIQQLQLNVAKYPMDTAPYLYIGRLYTLLTEKEAGAGKLAEENIQKAISINNKNPRIWYELGQAQLSQKKYQESLDSFKQAMNLNPDVALSSWFVSIGYYYVKDYQNALYYLNQALDKGYTDYQNNVNDMLRIVAIYEKVGNYQKVVEFYKLAVGEKPNVAQFHASLATAYAMTGDYNNARIEALKAAELDPQFKAEADKFINSLPK